MPTTGSPRCGLRPHLDQTRARPSATMVCRPGTSLRTWRYWRGFALASTTCLFLGHYICSPCAPSMNCSRQVDRRPTAASCLTSWQCPCAPRLANRRRDPPLPSAHHRYQALIDKGAVSKTKLSAVLGLACACKDVIVIETFDPELRRPALIMLRCQTYEELEKSHNAFVAACAVKPEVTAVQLRSMLPAFSADEYSRIRGLDENLAASELSYPRWAEATMRGAGGVADRAVLDTETTSMDRRPGKLGRSRARCGQRTAAIFTRSLRRPTASC